VKFYLFAILFQQLMLCDENKVTCNP